MQHRGQEGAGIVVTDGKVLQAVKGEGLVNEVFNEEKLKSLKGNAQLGMYGIQQQAVAESKMFNRLLFRSTTGSLAVAHNGNIVNANHLKQHLRTIKVVFSKQLQIQKYLRI